MIKYVLPVLFFCGVTLTGCSKGDDDNTPVKPQVALNPSGQPRNAEESAQAKAQREMGEKADAEAKARAEAQKEAMARTGGK